MCTALRAQDASADAHDVYVERRITLHTRLNLFLHTSNYRLFRFVHSVRRRLTPVHTTNIDTQYSRQAP